MQKNFIGAIISVILLITLSVLMLKGSGFYPEFDWQATVLMAFFIVAFSSSQILFRWFVVPFTLIFAIYTPVGLSFGGPAYQHIASLVATDLSEGSEFLGQISLWNYMTAVAILILLWAFRFVTQKYGIQLFKNKAFLAFSATALAINAAPFKLFQSAYKAGMDVLTELKTLNENNIPSQWGQSNLNENAKYDDYILIIGESARKDYLHAYGYPIENTPFMDRYGTLVDGLTSGGHYTIASLKLMLTQPNKNAWKENYGLNVVDLVKSAGIKTYWLSNQGYLGQWDTPISSIGNKSDIKFFTKTGTYTSNNASDFDLIPKLKEMLADKTPNKRFIVLHLYGSHPNACDRVTDVPLILKESEIKSEYKELNCYISSIKKTDQFIEQVYQTLMQNKADTQRKFSILYFADHGLAQSKGDKGIEINNKAVSTHHFDIPLYKIADDDSEHKMLKSFKSALNFTDGIGNWIGINNPKIDKNVNLFSGKDDENNFGLKDKIKETGKQFGKETVDDPAIDIRK